MSVVAAGASAGRVALVTGAAGGIGREITRRMSRDGATVAVSDRQPSPVLDALAAEVGGVAAPADVVVRTQVAAMVAVVENSAGTVDTLVCNHAYLSMAPFTEHRLDDWWRVVDTNLTGTYHLIQAVLPGMRRRGGGRVVIVSSYWGLVGWPNASAYAASKAGLVALTKTLGRELAPHGIAVNAVAPGVIDTAELDVDAADAGVDAATIRQRYSAGIPAGRIGRPEEVAAAVAFLADPRMGAMVGQVLQVTGGEARGRA